MLPSIFGEDLFDDFFGDPFEMMVPQSRNPLYGKHAKNLMKTDVRETEDSYELDIDLPGFKKEDVSVELKNGYLTIQAAKSLDKDELLRRRGRPPRGREGQIRERHPADLAAEGRAEETARPDHDRH